MSRRVVRRAVTAALLVLLTACGAGSEAGSSAGSGTGSGPSDGQALPDSSSTPSVDPSAGAGPTEPDGSADEGSLEEEDGHAIEAVRPKKLRPGERRLTLRMPASYTPSAPTGVGTDDYRCFLLDPRLKRDAFLTGTFVQPGNADVVHHVILFRVPPEKVAEARLLDDATEGEGWSCFGNSGLSGGPDLDSAPWIGAWAPGGKESVREPGFGVKLEKGTQIVMQVHYNLLAGPGADESATMLRLAPGTADLTSLETMLLPAPVELPCRAKHADGPLCSRDAAVADTKRRFGAAGNTADLLHFLCGTAPKPGNVQSCKRTLSEPMTIRAVAGHMHLLGRSITVTVNAGTPDEQTILDIPVWDFDDQGARTIAPIQLDAFETVTVTCRHVQWLRDRLPAFEGQPDKYVVWGEGTTDEMCLSILQVTRP